MTVGTLLGVKIPRRYAEHVVTLNAHTVKDGLTRRRRLMLGIVGLGRSGLVCHKQILA